MSIYLATGPNFTFTGTWGSDALTPINKFNNAPGGAAVATCTATGLAAGRYLLGINYAQSSNRSAAVNVVVKDGGTTLGTVLVNQQQNNVTGFGDGTAVASGAGINDGTWLYASLGFWDLSSNTLVVDIFTPDGGGGGGNYAVVGAIGLTAVAAGYNGPILPGYNFTGTTKVLYLPNTVDPLGATVFAFQLVNQIPASILSAGVDTHGGNVQARATFFVPNLVVYQQQYLALRTDGTPFDAGYYAYLDLNDGSIKIRSYTAGSGTDIGQVYAVPTLNANHLYTFTANCYTSTKTIVELFVQDLSSGSQYVTDLGTLSAIPQPCVTSIDDPVTTGTTPFPGAGHSAFATYNTPVTAEAHAFGAVPAPGITPYTSLYPIRYRFDTAGNPLQIRNPGFWWDAVLGKYLMVGVDCSLGSYVPGAGSDYFPNPGGTVLYTSPDFLNWTFVRKITTKTIGAIAYDWILFPRIRKHPSNGLYYLFLECGYGLAPGALAILTASDPLAGSWTVVNANWTPGDGSGTGNGINFLEDGGQTYLIRNGGESGTDALFAYAPLNTNWTDLATPFNKFHITGLPSYLGSSYQLEANVVFKHGGYYYAAGSQATGWPANPNQFARSSTLAGPYTTCPYAYVTSVIPNASYSYATQINDVFILPDGTVVLSADRWMPTDFNTCMHMLLPLAFDGSANPTVPWSTWVPAPPPSIPANTVTLAALAGPASVSISITSGLFGPLVIGDYYSFELPTASANDPWGVDPEETTLLN